MSTKHVAFLLSVVCEISRLLAGSQLDSAANPLTPRGVNTESYILSTIPLFDLLNPTAYAPRELCLQVNLLHMPHIHNQDAQELVRIGAPTRVLSHA